LGHPRRGRHELGELGDRKMERFERPKTELVDLAGRAPIAVDHDARPVPGAIGDPRLRLAVGQRERDERGAQIMDPNLAAGWAVLEERGAGCRRGPQLRSRRGPALRPLIVAIRFRS
jgi:hypothetical protein